MTWVKIDDGFADHPKVASLPPDVMLPAVGLHVLALCYCAHHLTDGFLPDPQVARLAGDLTQLLPHGTVDPLVNALLNVGMWELPEDDRQGYLIHDYLDYNPSRREVLRSRRELSFKRSQAGIRGMESRWSNKTDGLSNNNPIATGITHAKQTDNPVPVPVPLETTEALVHPDPTTIGTPRRSKGRQNGTEPDKAFIDSLRVNPAYRGIDIDREVGRIRAWLMTPRGRGKALTRRRLISWLNRIDTPMNLTPPDDEDDET